MYKIVHSTLFCLLFVLADAQSHLEEDSFFKTAHHELYRLHGEVNTDGDDVAHFRYAAKLFFSKPVAVGLDGQRSARMYSVTGNGGPIPFAVQPTKDDWDLSFSSMTVKGNRIYYALTKEATSVSKAIGQIWYRDKQFDGQWGPPVRLPKDLHLNPEYITHPATGILRGDRKDVLFFTAQLYNGKGGTDIWMCEVRADGTFSQPVSLPFNSKADEATPFFDVFNQTMYFASKGFDSFGGFDIFRSKYLGDGRWEHPENLGRPINSIYDDLHFSFNEAGDHCYLSSSRPNPACAEGLPHCRNLDIYRVHLQATLLIYVFDESDNSLLNGCNIELEDVATGQIIITYLNLEANFSSIGLEADKQYNLIISKPGYFPLKKPITAEGKDFFIPSLEQFHLRPMHMGATAVAFAKNNEPTKPWANELVGKGGEVDPSPEMVTVNSPKAIAAHNEVAHVVGKMEPPASIKAVTLPPDIEEAVVQESQLGAPMTLTNKSQPESPKMKKQEVTDAEKPLSSQFVMTADLFFKKEKGDLKSVTVGEEVAPKPLVEKEKVEKGRVEENTLPVVQKKEIKPNETPVAKPLLENQTSSITKSSEKPKDSVAASKIEEKPLATQPVIPPAKEEKPKQEVAASKTEERSVVTPPPSSPAKEEKPVAKPPAPANPAMDDNRYLMAVKDHFMKSCGGQLTLVADLPTINIHQPTDPVDLLFYHQGLQCYVVFDRIQKDFQSQGRQTMGDYLAFISSYKAPGQQPSVGITLYDGGQSKKVVYTFLEGMGADGRPTYFHTDVLPDYYRGMLPQSGELIGVGK